MALDFRATQVRTSKIISSGSAISPGTKLVIYDFAADGSPANQGVIDTTVFSTASIGTDIFMYVSGARRSLNSDSGFGATAFGGDVYASGSVVALDGLSGSHQRLVDGTPAFVAGYGIEIVTQSNGAVAVSSSVSGSIFTSSASYARTTASVSFDTDSRYPTSIGSNVFFFVSGSRSGFGTSGVSVFGGDTYVSGAMVAVDGLSGSHQRLTDGTPAFIAGDGMIIATQSNGAIAISSSVSGSVFTSSASYIKTTASVSFDTDSRYPTAIGSDVFFFVSGSRSSFGTSGVSVFGGDTYISGVLVVSGGLSGSLQRLIDGTPAFVAGDGITVTTQSNGAIAISASAASVSGSIFVLSSSAPPPALYAMTTASVSFDTSERQTPAIGSDVFFFVSGAINSIGTEGVAVFGGDLVVSGNQTVSGNLTVTGPRFQLIGDGTERPPATALSGLFYYDQIDGFLSYVDSDPKWVTFPKKTYMNVAGYTLTTQTSSSPQVCGQVWVDNTEIPTGSIFLRAIVSTTTASNIAYVRLWNITSGSYVHIWGPDVLEMATTATTPEFLESDPLWTATNFTQAAGAVYEVQLYTSSSDYPAILGSAQFVFGA